MRNLSMRLAGRRPAAQRPNVLFIVADDLNGWIGAMGRHPDVKTPAIDALAARGTMFVNAYCASPYCNSSRMSVFTGCLPSTTGIYNNEKFWNTEDRRSTFVEKFREAGYYTFGAGKVFHGYFDYRTAGREGLREATWIDSQNRPQIWDHFDPFISEPLPDDRPLNGMFDFSEFDKVPDQYHMFDWGPLPDDVGDRTPDEAVFQSVSAFLGKPTREPFFCAAGLYKPHLPWHTPKRFFDLYDPETVSLPVVRRDDLDDVPPIARKWALNPPDHELIEAHGQWREAVVGYLAAISYCDWIVGRLIEALDAAGLADTTAIVLWGDNGFHLGEKLHWRKFVLWEEATKVPLLVVMPGMKQAARVYDPVSLIDLFPTLWEVCGLGSMPPVDGQSLVGLMNGDGKRTAPATSTWLQGNHSLATRSLAIHPLSRWHGRAVRPGNRPARVDEPQRRPQVCRRESSAPGHAAVRLNVLPTGPSLHCGGQTRPIVRAFKPAGSPGSR